jgi:hypothetical protein
MFRLGSELEVGTSKRHDPGICCGTAVACEAIRPQPGAGDNSTGAGFTALKLSHGGSSGSPHPFHLASQQNASPGFTHVVGQTSGNGWEVNDARVGRVKRGKTAAVWLDRPDLFSVDPSKARDAIGMPAYFEIVESIELICPGRHDQLSAALEGQPLGVAVIVKSASSFDAESRFEGAGFVVDTGVDDAAVVT